MCGERRTLKEPPRATRRFLVRLGRCTDCFGEGGTACHTATHGGFRSVAQRLEDAGEARGLPRAERPDDRLLLLGQRPLALLISLLAGRPEPGPHAAPGGR